jgi:hypothetical protein
MASLSSPQLDANPFLPPAPNGPVLLAKSCWSSPSPARHRDGAGTAIMGICRDFESNLSGAAAHALKRDFDDGHE